MKLYTFLLVMSFSQWNSAVELNHKHVIRVKNKSYSCLFKLHYEGDVCFQDSTVTCTPNVKKKAVAKNIKLVLKDGTVMSIAKVEISKKKDKMTGCKVTSRPTPPITIKPTTECHSKNTMWKSGIQQLQLSAGGSNEKNWEACGTKCTSNDDCQLWEFSETTGWCWNFAETGNAKMADGDNIIGRKGCPATECHSENSNWKSGIQQLELSAGGSYEQSWEACGTKCTNNDDCQLWKFSESTGWCWNYAETGKAKMTIGDDITGRKGCPAEQKNRTVTCGFNDEELAGKARSPVDPNSGYKWAGGKIPFFFTNSVTSNDRYVFRQVMRQIHDKTCFRFEEKHGEPRGHHLEISVGSRTCYGSAAASVWIPWNQNTKMRLHSEYQLADQSRCNWKGLVLHELMHVLGVMHTQKRRDRNSYITVNYNNIPDTANAKHQYNICEHCWISSSIPYECRSIMHYGTRTGGNGNGPTMTAKNPPTCRMDRNGPSVPTPSDWNLLKIIASDVCSQASGCAYTDNYSTYQCEYWKDEGDCTSGPWMNDMHTNCAKTCKCNSGCSFTDNSSNCPAFKQYCYVSWIMSTCPKTCKC